MCLRAEEKVTKRLKRAESAYRICYKHFRLNHDGSKSKIVSTYTFAEMKLKNGWYVSNRKSKHLSPDEKTYKYIERGIHVFLNKNDCIYDKEKRYSLCVFVVPVKCYKKDLVAGGSFDDICPSAVYMKVKIDPKELKKAINKVSPDWWEMLHV